MTREEAIKMLKSKMDGHTDTSYEWAETVRMAIKALEHPEQNVIAVVPCGDAISRQEALKLFATNDGKYLYEAIRDLPRVTPKQTIEREFAKWVAEEIFDDNWEYNYGAFAELACRKLEKMGIIKADGDEWHLVESEEEDDEG